MHIIMKCHSFYKCRINWHIDLDNMEIDVSLRKCYYNNNLYDLKYLENEDTYYEFIRQTDRFYRKLMQGFY